jgi:UDP-N-acetylglucosamine 2-epimerase
VKLLTVVGARPQFIKASPFSRAVRTHHAEVLVHTGQHYDPALSDVFFDELSLPRPDYNLEVGSDTHARQTARILERLEPVLQRESPDAVIVFGDTNSTLAGALAAAKLGTPVAHVEAGLRSYVRDMPEEINRVAVDSISTWLFAPTASAIENLRREGAAIAGESRPKGAQQLARSAHLTGDIMYDALLLHAEAGKRSHLLADLALRPGAYAVATIHRAANTDDPARLRALLDALAGIGMPVVLPLHPRTRDALAARGAHPPASGDLKIIEPVGYLDMLALQKHAGVILTDSGGMQKEAYLLGVPCVTLRDETEWPETLAGGWNVLAGAEPRAIADAAHRASPAGVPPPVFGDGHAAERMVAVLEADLDGGASRR